MSERPNTARRAAAAASEGMAAVAALVRERRAALRLSVRAAAARCGVSPTVIFEVEKGLRIPSLPTYEKLREGLGLAAPPSARLPTPPRPGLNDDHLTALAACVVLQRGGGLAELGTALGISVAAVREGLLDIAGRLDAVGLRAVEDGAEIRVGPLPVAIRAAAAVARLQPVPEPTPEQLEVVAIVAHHGSASRRQIELLRHTDSETLIRGLIAHDLLETVPGSASPTLYRVTALAVAATGHPTLESLQAYLGLAVTARDEAPEACTA